MFYYRNRTFTFILNEKNIEIHNNYLCRIFLILIQMKYQKLNINKGKI
jgi:hypothetical protein